MFLLGYNATYRAACAWYARRRGSGAVTRLSIALVVAIPLASCASHSGVVPDGAGGYLISQQAAPANL